MFISYYEIEKKLKMGLWCKLDERVEFANCWADHTEKLDECVEFTAHELNVRGACAQIG